jgi:hypothetical protein
MKLLFACFVVVWVTWMSFTSGGRELRGDILSMLETHIVMSSLISRLILILIFCLARTLVFRLTLFHVLRLSSLMDLTIAHMVLVHERTALCLEAHTQFESRHLDGPYFPQRGSCLTRPNGELERIMKISSGRMVKCWIPKIYLTNPNMEPSTPSRPM